MQRSTSGRREECQGYCWYAPFRGPSTFHWQLNWLRSARGATVPWGFATTVILKPAVLLPVVDWSRVYFKLSAARTRTRSRRRQQLCPFVEVTEPGRNSEMSIHSEKLTHPRTPPQRAYRPGMWGSDRDHSPSARQRPHPETHGWHVVWSLPDATSSLERRTRECSFREKNSFSVLKRTGEMVICNTNSSGSAVWCVQSTRHGKNHHRCRAIHQHESLPKSVLNSLNSLVSRSQEQNDVTARLRSEKLNMRCTCCLLILTLWSASAECNNRMPMCIGSFSLHSKWIGLSKRYPNSSVLRRDVESDRLIGNTSLTTSSPIRYDMFYFPFRELRCVSFTLRERFAW